MRQLNLSPVLAGWVLGILCGMIVRSLLGFNLWQDLCDVSWMVWVVCLVGGVFAGVSIAMYDRLNRQIASVHAAIRRR